MSRKALYWCARCERTERLEVPPNGWKWVAEDKSGGWLCDVCQLQYADGDKALTDLPEKLRGFYEAHYQLIPSTGKFVGLACKMCNKWQEYGHDSDCPVKGLE